MVVHVFYPEVWPDIVDRFARIPEPFDLIVSLVQGDAEGLERSIQDRLPMARVEVVPNRGRDLASLVSLANRGLLSGYDAILKVHSKRSPHRLDGDAWRVRLLDGVLPSPEGQLGLGASYFASSGRQDGSAILRQGYVNFKGLFQVPLFAASAAAVALALFFHPPKNVAASASGGSAPAH